MLFFSLPVFFFFKLKLFFACLFITSSLQMTKLAIIPFTVLLETLFLKKQFRYIMQRKEEEEISILSAMLLINYLINCFFQPKDKVLTVPITSWSRDCFSHRSPAQFRWHSLISSCHHNNMRWPNCILFRFVLLCF